jgi:glyoxylase-like metal-dependent hydrolase (beta-lactamase superfamily II)
VAGELAVAERADEVLAGVWFWDVHDPRIDFLSSSHAITGHDGTVLVDPMPLAPQAFADLGGVIAICISAGSHQRAAWRYRRDLDAQVWAPALSRTLEEEPNVRYGDGEELPGGLRAVFTPGAGTTQHSLLLDRDGGVVFVPDLLVRPQDGRLRLVPARFMHDPAEARRSVRKLLELPFSVLCLGHGAPVTEGAKEALAEALAREEAKG